MHPNKIEVGQRVRVVLTETSGPVLDCEGVIIKIDDSGNALVEYDDGWSRWYNKPVEQLIAVEDKEPEKWEDLLHEIGRLREENARLRRAVAWDLPGQLWKSDKGLHLTFIKDNGEVGLVKLSSGNTYPASVLGNGSWSYVGESEGRNWQ